MITLRVWVARFRSVCGICDETIEEGERGVYVDGVPCHAQCAEDDDYEVAE